MLILRMAFRNIFRHRRRSLLTGLMMAGGCFLFSISLGIVDGSYGNLIDMFTRDRTGHIQVHLKGYLETPTIYKTIREPGLAGGKIDTVRAVESWAPRVYTPALAFAGPKTTGVDVVGIEPGREARVTRVRAKIQTGRYLQEAPDYGIIISKGLSRLLKAGLGDEVALIAQGVDGSVANDLFTVVGITGEEQMTYGALRCYIHIGTARKFLSMGREAHEIAVVLEDQAETLDTVPLMDRALDDPSLVVEPWQVVEAQFYRAMQADIKGNWFSLMVLTIIIAVGVLNTVLMVILERTREFGVMRALGTRPFQVFILIVLETASLAALGIVPGTLAGVAANWYLSAYGITISEGIEWGGVVFDRILGKVTFNSMAVPAALVLATAVVVSIPPALRAARIKPVRAMERP